MDVAPPARAVPLERLYLWLALPFGLFFALVNAPFIGVPDELAHYYKALALAQGQLSRAGQAAAPDDYVYLRQSLSPMEFGEDWHKLDLGAVRQNLTSAASEGHSYVPARVGFALPLAYAPQALGLRLALELRAPPLVGFYLGRLLAFALAAWLIHRAIRIAPCGKLAFLLVGLLPMTLQQLASYSYDSVHLGVLLFFTAHVLARARKEGAFTAGELNTTFLLAVVASVLKPGYVLVPLLVLALPRRSFRSRAAHVVFGAAAVVASVAVHVLARAHFDEAAPGFQLDPGAQLRRVLADPAAFAAAAARTALGQARKYGQELVFVSGRSGASLPAGFYALAAAGLLSLALVGAERVRLARRQRLVLAGAVLAQGALLFLVLYLCCTPVGARRVHGMQGRYFTALLPALLVALGAPGLARTRAWLAQHVVPVVVAHQALVFAWAAWWLVRFYYGAS